jgi:hypothetical protein
MTEPTSLFCIFGYVTISSFVHIIIAMENVHFDIGEKFHKADKRNILWAQKLLDW